MEDEALNHRAWVVTKWMLEEYLNNVEAMALLVAYNDKPYDVYSKVREILKYLKELNQEIEVNK